MQGDGAIVALSLQPKKARSALRVMPEELTGKEVTCNKEVQRVTIGGAPNAPHNNRLHVVMVIGTSGITGLERVMANSDPPAALSAAITCSMRMELWA